MKLFLLLITVFVLSCKVPHSGIYNAKIPDKYAAKIDSVLSLMTLDEKIGQLNQYTGNLQATGPIVDDPYKIDQIKEGKLGAMLNIKGAAHTREMQEYAMQSRLKIPLLFGIDMIHGLRTVFPIPLGEAASFDLDLMRRTAEGAALEASAQGVHWTFAPMVDITRDARWGRVMEGAGEDAWYGSLVATARVRGFQGDVLSAKHTVLACAKHFAAYGACIAGKDYNTVDISELTLHDTYLPPFKAAVDAGVATFMNSFNDINGIPATAYRELQRDLLRGEWGFNGFTVSDWGSIRELVPHGYAADNKDAAKMAILAGCDMDMESRAYTNHLKELVESGEVSEEYIDDAVRRILLTKFQLGLFDDPFRYCDTARERQYVLCDQLKALSRESAQKSIVLLKNNNALPIPAGKGIALVGSLADSQIDMMGFWANDGVKEEVVTIKNGLKKRFHAVKYAPAYDIETNELTGVNYALSIAKESDVVVVVVGERYANSGEAKSRADINVNANQQQLVKELKRIGKKVVVLLTGGRPLIFNELEPYADAIVMTWWLGTEAGNAIADVVSGDYNPSAKLPMTFPAHVGQIPIYYNYKSTGRPEHKAVDYSCCYQDIDFKPAYPFGYGMSYTTFEIGEPQITPGDVVKVSVKIKNTGKCKGKETIQLYIRDLVASVTRPIKELRAISQVELASGEACDVEFELSRKDFGFVDRNLNFVVEPGQFVIMVGAYSENFKTVNYSLD